MLGERRERKPQTQHNSSSDTPLLSQSSVFSGSNYLSESHQTDLHGSDIATVEPLLKQLKMDNTLQVRPVEYNQIKAKAIEDAKQMQASVIEAATKAGKEPPKYALLELIGKGTFGRVYKGYVLATSQKVSISKGSTGRT